MNWKLKSLAAAMMGAGLAFGGPSASAQTIDNTNCGALPNEGLGEETCVDPSATRAEGVLWTAAEQAVSIMSAIADSSGCVAAAGGNVFGGSVDLDIAVNLTFGAGVQPHFEGESTLAGYTYLTEEQHYDTSIQNGVRQYATSDVTAGDVRGGQVSELLGTYRTDGDFAIMIGDADFRHGGAELDEHIIKDFYAGIPQTGEENPNDPVEPVRVVRDNGLEVTTKKHFVSDLLTTNTAQNVEVGFPQGKWRQTSFYREPNGPGEGQLTYTKVRIAPFGAAICAIVLDGEVRGDSSSQPVFDGSVSVFPLGNP